MLTTGGLAYVGAWWTTNTVHSLHRALGTIISSTRQSLLSFVALVARAGLSISGNDWRHQPKAAGR